MTTYVFDKKSVAANRSLRGQYEYLQAHRALHANTERGFAGIPVPGMVGNASTPVPYPVYAEMDAQTKAIMLDPNVEVLLNDLMPLARPLNIGKMIHQYRQAGSGGAVTSSISGLEPIPNDQTSYKYDGALVPVHQSGYYREWRELAGQQSEGWNDLLDDQAGSTRTVRERMAGSCLDGVVDANGNPLEFKGVKSYGIRNSANTAKATIGIDLTSRTTTPNDVREEFVRLRNILRRDNRVAGNLTVYVSPEIAATLDRYFIMIDGSGQSVATSRTLRAELESLEGIGAIKELSGLEGNELIMGVLSQEYIVPLLGQGVSNLALPRQTPFARHQFIVWSAMGLEIRADINGRTAWLYAASA
ncbi:major capsid protein [Salinicola sp. CR57]|uniref:major capsid protein n=1 Tax=Salinicola sp. CR57 TaxID=1949086 RepID=UPI000DA21271|nr:major capsid protein [Salinicola sp. CR57]